MKKNWLVFAAINIGGILVGTIVATGMLYVLGYAINGPLVTYCFAIAVALNLYGSFLFWPDIWQKKS